MRHQIPITDKRREPHPISARVLFQAPNRLEQSRYSYGEFSLSLEQLTIYTVCCSLELSCERVLADYRLTLHLDLFDGSNYGGQVIKSIK